MSSRNQILIGNGALVCLRSTRRGYPGLYLHLLCIRIWWWQFDIDHVLCGADNRLAADRYDTHPCRCISKERYQIHPALQLTYLFCIPFTS